MQPWDEGKTSKMEGMKKCLGPRVNGGGGPCRLHFGGREEAGGSNDSSNIPEALEGRTLLIA